MENSHCNGHCKRHCKREHKSKSSGVLQAAMPTPPPPAGAYNPSGGYPAGGYPGGAPQPIYNPVSTKRSFVIAWFPRPSDNASTVERPREPG